MRLSIIAIGLIIISLGAVLIGGLINEYNDIYPRSDYDNTTLEKMNKLNKMKNYSETIRNETEITANSNLFDVLGAYFSAGYASAKTAAGSVDVMYSMADSATTEMGKTVPYMEYFRIAIISILGIAVFIGIIVAILVKWRT